MDLVALVPADLSDLVAAYLQNRSQDLEQLKSALAAEDFATVLQMGERMYAVGNPYGFRQITTFGRQIREACALHDAVSIRQLVGHFEEYLGKVTIEVVPEPVPRIAWNQARPPWAKNDSRTSATPQPSDENDEEPGRQRQPGRQYGPPR